MLTYFCLKAGGQSLSGWPKLAMLTVVLSVVKQKKVCKKFSRIHLVSYVVIRLLYQKFNKRIFEIAKEYPKFACQSIGRPL